MKKSIKLFHFYLLVMCFNLYAVTPVFQNFDESFGLQDNNIKTITQDNYGHIWLGSYSGILKFDGYRFKKIDFHPSLKNIIVKKLTFDHNNSLFIVTKNNGLLLLKNNRVIKVHHPSHDTIFVTDVLISKDKKVWIATKNGLYNLSAQNTLIRPSLPSAKILNDIEIFSMTQLNSYQFIIAKKGGFYLLDSKRDTIDHISINSAELIHDVHTTNGDTIWIAGAHSFYRYDLNQKKFIDIPHFSQASRFLSIAQFNNTLWVATIDGGIYHFNIDTNKVTQFTHNNLHQYSLSEKHILSVFVSDKQQLWVGGLTSGLSMLDLTLLNFGYENRNKNSLSCAKTNNITYIDAYANNNVWLGNENGLIKFNRVNHSCEVLDIRVNGDVQPYTVYYTMVDNNYIWISASNGLLRYDNTLKHTIKINHPSTFQTSFFTTTLTNGNILVGTDNGLYEYNKQHKSLNTFDYSGQPLKQPFLKYSKNSKNHIFLPTSSGLFFINSHNQLKPFPSQAGVINSSEIITVAIDDSDGLFVSVYNNGLFHFKADGTLIKHYQDEYLFSPSNSIYQIQTDGKQLWMSSKKGIIYLDTENNQKKLYTGIDDNNYLASLIHSSDKQNGKIYFAGTSGFISFHPKDIDTYQQDTEVIINQLYLVNQPINTNVEKIYDFKLNQSIETTQQLDFSYHHKIIGFDLTTLNFTNIRHDQYAYQLKPTVNEWVTLLPGNRNLTFTNLASGKYTLNIKAGKNNS